MQDMCAGLCVGDTFQVDCCFRCFCTVLGHTCAEMHFTVVFIYIIKQVHALSKGRKKPKDVCLVGL